MRNLVSGRWGNLLLGAGLIGVLTTGTGCKKLLKKAMQVDAGPTSSTGSGSGDGGVAGNRNAAVDPEEEADDQLQDKVSEYIKYCTNAISARVSSSEHRYYQWVNPKVGPTGKEMNVYGLYDVNPNLTAECAKAVTRAKSMPPSNPKLEALADDYLRAATALTAVIPTAVKYYDQKDYKDDKWAKAKEYHTKLAAGFDDFRKANLPFREAIAGINKPLAKRELARIEKQEGKTFAYHRRHTLIAAAELVEASDPTDEAIDFALYDSTFKEFDSALTDLETYGSAHAAELAARKPISASSAYSSFTRDADAYRFQAKGYLRCLRDAPAKAKVKGKIDASRLPRCSDGDDMISKYNSFINTANSQRF